MDEKAIRIELRNEIVNKSRTPIILWQPVGLDGSWVKPYVFTGLKMSRDPAFAKRDILEDRYGGPSTSNGPGWDNMRKALDKASPPDRVTRTLLPDQSIIFDSRFYIICHDNPGYPTMSPSCKDLLEAGVVWVQVHYETWSLNLETGVSGPDQMKLKFGRKLQERWRNYGALQLDDMHTEPIRIDLKTAIQENRNR